MAQLDRRELLDLLEQLGRVDSKVLKVHKEIQVHKELRVMWEHLVQPDSKEPQDHKDCKDQQEALVPLVSRDLKVILVSLDKLERQEAQVLRAFRVQTVTQD